MTLTRTAATGGFGGSIFRRGSALRSQAVTRLVITMQTGGDDLRDGNLAFATVRLATLGTLPRVSLGGGFPNDSVRTASVSLPVGLTLANLASITIEHDGAPRNLFDTYDNWNLDAIKIAAVGPTGTYCILGRTGAPLIRFTGSTRILTLPIALP